MYSKNNFYKLLLIEILENLTSQYDDNYDEGRFGKISYPKFSLKFKLKEIIKKQFKSRNVSLIDTSYKYSLAHLNPYLDDISLLYETLSDQSSKFLLVQLIAYRVLGYKKYKLPLSTPDYWKGIEDIDKLRNDKDYLTVKFPERPLNLYRFNLQELNIPINLYNTKDGIYSNLTIKQYEYITNKVCIRPEKDDIVLDCGACWGETALFFANEVGEKGHIYSFEFVPGNINVFNKNIELNPHLKDKITLVPHPLDRVSGKKLFYDDNGPASRVSEQNFPDAQITTTLCIDDFYTQYGLDKVDFIKMDIEGAELPALKGALNVIRKFRPKLAISIYHSLDDFVSISKYIDSLDLGYKFYLKHGTIHREETVLLAIVEKNSNYGE